MKLIDTKTLIICAILLFTHTVESKNIHVENKIKQDIKPALCKLNIKKTHKDIFTYENDAIYQIDISNTHTNACSIKMQDTLANNVTFDTLIFNSNPNIHCSSHPNNTLTCTGFLQGKNTAHITFKVHLPKQQNAIGKGWSRNNHLQNCAKVYQEIQPSYIDPNKIKPISLHALAQDCDTTEVQTKKHISFCRADVQLVLDHSASMHQGDNSKLEKAKQAAQYFATAALNIEGNKVGITQFDNTNQLVQTLTINRVAVSSAIAGITSGRATNIPGGFFRGKDDFKDNSYGVPRILILLTDGSNSPRFQNHTQTIIDEAKANHITLYTIGLGNSVNTTYLTHIAQETNGKYTHAQNNEALSNIFSQVADKICDKIENNTSKISGLKFHDMNGNGHQDTGEKPLADIPIVLYPADSNGTPTGSIIAQTSTAKDGTYSFSNIPTGTYLVKEDITVLQDWTQTFPTTNNGCHKITLAKGQHINNLNFGNANCKDRCDATISGFKYQDRNKNGKFDKGEEKLANWTFELIHEDGTSIFTTTDTNGIYTFNISHHQLNEKVTLKEWLQPNWVAVSPTQGIYTNIQVYHGDSLSFLFGNSDICDSNSTNGHQTSSIYPDVSIKVSKEKQLVLKNIGNAPTTKMGLLITNTHDIKNIVTLDRWTCTTNKAMQQISCKYQDILDAGEEITVSLPMAKMKYAHINVLAEYDSNISNNQIYLSDK